MKTPFYELAEKIGNEGQRYGYISILTHLKIYEYYYFLSIFETLSDFDDGDDHRILALLFADLLWQDEMKGGKK